MEKKEEKTGGGVRNEGDEREDIYIWKRRKRRLGEE